MKKIFIVIPNWNGEDLISNCLNSLIKQTINSEVVVVDNGSVDKSIDIIESEFPKVKLIKLEKNTGFSGGVNTGIKYAMENKADFVALFNNDAVASKDWLEKLVSAAEQHPETGIVTGKLLRSDKLSFDSTGDCYSIWGVPFPRGRNQIDKAQYDKAEYVFSGTGGASLYRIEMLKAIGLFDEKFFAYYEDVDISYRAQLAGWKVWYEPKATAFHHVGATSSKHGDFTRYHATKNFFLLYAKNMPTKLYFKYLPFFFIQSVKLMISSLIKGKVVVFFKSVIKTISYTPYIISQRSKIQHSKKVSSKYIDSLLYKGRPPKIPKF